MRRIVIPIIIIILTLNYIIYSEIKMSPTIRNMIMNKNYVLVGMTFSSKNDDIITKAQIFLESIPLENIKNDIFIMSKTDIDLTYYSDDLKDGDLKIVTPKYKGRLIALWRIDKNKLIEIQNQLVIEIKIESENKFLVYLNSFQMDNNKISGSCRVTIDSNDWLKDIYVTLNKSKNLIRIFLPILKQNNLEYVLYSINTYYSGFSPNYKYFYLETENNPNENNKLTWLIFDIDKEKIILKSFEKFENMHLIGWHKKNNLFIFNFGTDVPRNYQIYDLKNPEKKPIELYGVCHRSANNYDENVYISNDMKYICYYKWLRFDHGANDNRVGVCVQNL